MFYIGEVPPGKEGEKKTGKNTMSAKKGKTVFDRGKNWGGQQRTICYAVIKPAN